MAKLPLIIWGESILQDFMNGSVNGGLVPTTGRASAVGRKQISDLKFQVSVFIAKRKYWGNVDKSHYKHMRSDAAWAASLIWALAGASQQAVLSRLGQVLPQHARWVEQVCGVRFELLVAISVGANRLIIFQDLVATSRDISHRGDQFFKVGLRGV